MNRRGFLMSAAAPIGVTVIGSTKAQASAASIEASPALFTLQRTLNEAWETLQDAWSAFDRVFAAANEAAPAVPSELVTRVGHWHDLSYPERDIADRVVCERAGSNRNTRDVRSAHEIRLDVADYGPRTKIGREARRLLPIAEAYEAERKAVQERTGVVLALSKIEAERTRTESVCEQMLGIPAANMPDVEIKAVALWVSGKTWRGQSVSAMALWAGPQFASEVVQFSGGAVA